MPLNVHSPLSGWSKPVNWLKNVDLPAPFGPMSAVIAPRWISMWPTSTAVRPPNLRTMSSTMTIGSGLGEPGSWATSRRAATATSFWEPAGAASSGIERDLPLVAKDSLRTENHQEHQQ